MDLRDLGHAVDMDLLFLLRVLERGEIFTLAFVYALSLMVDESFGAWDATAGFFERRQFLQDGFRSGVS